MGTKMTIWKQGQFYPELGKTIVELPGRVDPGPSDYMIDIAGFHVQPDKDGNFIENGSEKYSIEELDAINTFGIIRSVIDIYEELLERKIQWSWWNEKKEPLSIDISNQDINSRFIREQKLIQLDHYGPADALVFTCRSVDLIAHEAGHAILDTIRPSWSVGKVEARGLEEAFCDLAAMFFVLYRKDLCLEVIAETKGNLRQNSILSLFGVGFGTEDQPGKAIRNANNQIDYKGGIWNWYRYSQLIVGILYDILTAMLNQNKQQFPNDVEALYELGKEWMRKVVRCFLGCKSENSSVFEFFDIVKNEFSDYDIDKYIRPRGVF